MHYINIYVLFALFSMILATSCRKEFDYDPFVRTEDILYVSGEQIIMTGRVIAQRDISLESHGFEISTDESFSNPITIDLGRRKVPGRFIVQSDELQHETNYYARAFMIREGKKDLGEVISLRTLAFTIDNFSPKYGSGGYIVELRGTNFSKDTKVYFDDREAEVISVDFESTVRVRVPPLANKSVTTISVEIDGKSATYIDSFEYIIGLWNQVGVFDQVGNSLMETTILESDENVYLSFGVEVGIMPVRKRFWKLTKNDGKWKSVEFPGIAVLRPFASFPYFGSGAVKRVAPSGALDLELSSDFWKIEGDSFVPLEPLPFRVYKAAAFSTTSGLLVFGGLSSDRTYHNRIYAWTKESNSWKIVADCPFDLDSDIPHFAYHEQYYFINSQNKIFVFNPTKYEWSTIGIYPGQVGDGGISVVMQDRVFVGIFSGENDIWEMDLLSNEWILKNGFSGDDRNVNVGYWQNEGEIFIMKDNFFGSSLDMLIYKFDPDAF